FKTSRSPVHEALLMLERDRLVQRIPHQGVVIRQFTRTDIHEFIRCALSV
ncbi:GntR family transcriptional regulator, partial [Alkalihalophilus lindianensis]